MRIETRGLTVRYGSFTAVQDVDLVAETGRVLGVIGPNGSGKSSFVKAVAGLCRAEGRVLFGGEALRPHPIGYMPQDVGARAALTVLETVLLGRLGRLGLRVEKADLDRVRAVLTELGIEALAPRYLGELSGGQRQLVFLAQALAAEPRILLLDEPISALDIRHQLEVLAIVRRLTRERQLTTIAVLHDLNATARWVDAVAILAGGRLVGSGTPGEVLTAATIERVFEVETDVTIGPDGHPVIVPTRAVPRERAA